MDKKMITIELGVDKLVQDTLESDEALRSAIRNEVAELMIRSLSSAKIKKMIETEVKKKVPSFVRDVFEQDDDVYDELRHTVVSTVVKILKTAKF